MTYRNLYAALAASTCIVALATPAAAQTRHFNVPASDLATALDSFARQSGLQIVYKVDEVQGKRSKTVKGNLDADDALRRLLSGSGFAARRDGASFAIVKGGNAPAAANDTVSSGQSAVAQPDGNSGIVEQEIVVTGTNIRGASSAAPVQVFSRQKIEESGVATVQDFVKRLPQNFNGGASEDTIGGAAGGTGQVSGGSSVNLRGLGSDSTLVLLNGRRLAPADINGDFIDISLIPLNAIDRIEIVTDGASAIYGSDAVGGVANFILRDTFDGPETKVRYGTVTEGSSRELTLGQTGGANWAGGSAFLSYEYYDRTPLDASDRGQPVPPDAPFSLLPRQRRHAVLASAHHEISPTLELFADGTYSNRRFELRYADIFEGVNYGLYRDNSRINTFSLTGGARVGLPGNFLAELTTTYAGSQTHQKQVFLDTGDIFQDRRFKTSLFSADGKIDGDVVQLPGGNLKIAVGAQYRRETYNKLNPVGRSFDDHRSVYAAFAEIRVPILPPMGGASQSSLELTVADRYEHYSDFGSANSPQLGAVFRPLPGLKIRGTWGRSFKAPLLSNLDGDPVQIEGYSFADPRSSCACGTTNTILLTGGNSALSPEKARTWTLGFDVRPAATSGFRFSFSYYNIDYRDRIVSPLGGLAAADVFLLEDILGPDIVQRFPDPAALQSYQLSPIFRDRRGSANTRPFTTISDFRLQNLSSVSTDGLDFSVSYATTTEIGRIQASADATYILSFKNQFAPNTEPDLALNTPYNPVDLRVRSSLGWEKDGLAATIFANYVDSYKDNRGLVGSSQRISSWLTADLTIQYRFAAQEGPLSGLTAMIGATNITDEKPPFVANRFAPVNYDGANANALGRFVYLQLTKAW